MAISQATWGTVAATNGATPVSPAYPSPAAGDLLLAFFYSRLTSGGAVTTPSGWNVLVASTQTANGLYAIFWKVAAGTEGTGTQAIAYTGGSSGSTGTTAIARICKISGADTTNPLDGSATKETEAAGSPVVNGGCSPAVAGSLVMLFTGKGDGGNGTTDDYSAWTGNSLTWQGVANGSTSGADAAIGIGDAIKSDTGATGNLQANCTLTFTGISCSLAIKAAGAAQFQAAAIGGATVAADLTANKWIERDAGFPKVAHQALGTGTSLATAAFDVPAGGRLLVAVAAWMQQDTNDPGEPSITDNQGTHLNWTSVGSSYWTDSPTWPAYLRMWVADAPDAITGLTVTTSVVAGGNRIGFLNVDCLKGAGDVAQVVGATAARQAPGATAVALSVTLSAQAAQSWIAGIFATGNTSTALTADSNTTNDDHQEDASVGGAIMAGHKTDLTPSAGSYTVGTTYPSNQYALWVVAELKKMGAAQFQASATGAASLGAALTTAIALAAAAAGGATLAGDLSGGAAQFQAAATGSAVLTADLTAVQAAQFQASAAGGAALAAYLEDERPAISPASGAYTTARTVTITKAGGSGMTIRYTTDGSRPTPASTAYSGSFQVSSTGVVRAAIFSSTGYEGPVATAWYVIEDGSTNLIGPQHTRVIDGSSKLLSWLPQSIAYGKMIERISDRLVAMPLDTDAGHAAGFPQFLFHSYLDASLNPAGNWASAPGGQIGMMLDSAVAAYPYTGNGELMKLMKMMLAYLIKNGSTPASGSWQRAIYNEADPDEVPFIGAGDNGGGVGDGQGNLEPDKQAEIGWGALQLWMHDPTQTDFRDLAIRLADQLCANRKTSTSASVSPWPFRTTQANNTRPSGAGAGEDYCSNLAPYIRLFDDLIRLGLGSTSNYQTARDAFWTWATTYPLSSDGDAGPWGHYFEDQPWSSVYTDDPCNLNPNNMARLLLERPSLTASYLTWAANLAAYVETTFGDTAVYGAIPINEQDWYMWPMGSHTSRAGLVRALLYAANSSETDKDKAFRALNWTTYMHRNDGFSLDGYPTPNQIWMTDGFGDTIRHFALAMYAVPEWAPPGEDHLLGSTSVVQSVRYAKDRIDYQTFDAGSREVLRLSFSPTMVTAGGSPLSLRSDLNAEGYTWDAALKVLRIRHDSSGQVVVAAGAAFDAAAVGGATLSATLTGGSAAEFAASATGSATLSAALTTSVTLQAAASGAATVAASLTTVISLSAAASGATSLGAALTTAIQFQAGAVGAATVAASLTTTISLQAAASGVATLSATLAGTAAQFGAAAVGGAVLSATLTTAILLQAGGAGAATLSAVVTTAIQFVASATGSATLTANLAGAGAIFQAAGQGGATLTAELTLPGAEFSTAAQGGAFLVADLQTSITLVAAARSEVTLAATLTGGLDKLLLVSTHRVDSVLRLRRVDFELKSK